MASVSFYSDIRHRNDYEKSLLEAEVTVQTVEGFCRWDLLAVTRE